jgi:hypothetical protein
VLALCKAPDASTDVPAFLPASCAHVGRIDEARYQLDAFHRSLQRNIARFEHGTSIEDPRTGCMNIDPMRQPVDQAYFFDGLRPIGLIVPPDFASAA